MAKAKTAVFTITDGVTLNNGQSGAANMVTMDVGHMIDAASSQGLEILSADFMFQNSLTSAGSFSPDIGASFGADSTVTVQLTDVNPGTALVGATDRSLVASTNLHYGHGDNIVTSASDFQPDSFEGDGRYVVNDTLYLTADPSTTIVSNQNLEISCRLRCKIVTLSKKDWIALALQTGPL
jgi:hypothetical protein